MRSRHELGPSVEDSPGIVIGAEGCPQMNILRGFISCGVTIDALASNNERGLINRRCPPRVGPAVFAAVALPYVAKGSKEAYSGCPWFMQAPRGCSRRRTWLSWHNNGEPKKQKRLHFD